MNLRQHTTIYMRQHTTIYMLTLHCYCTNIQGVFFLWIQLGGCKSANLMSFKQFLYFLHSKLWAHFHFGTFGP